MSARSRILLRHAQGQIDTIVEGQGPAIVLLPSSQRDSKDFDAFAQLLAEQGFRVLRPQPRGMGDSSAPPADMTMTTLAQDLAFCIQQLADGPAVVVGHAFGHWVARVLDLQYPDCVRGIVVLAGAARVFPAGLINLLDTAANHELPDAVRIEALKSGLFAEGNDPRPWLQGWHPQLAAAYRQAAQSPPKDVWWSISQSPILDLQGACDPWRPESSRRELSDRLGTKVTVQTIAQASHAMIPEQPEAVAQAIVQWVRSLDKPSSRNWKIS
jgi:pimeloyl-ACP methyl ester carboxylesterase